MWIDVTFGLTLLSTVHTFDSTKPSLPLLTLLACQLDFEKNKRREEGKERKGKGRERKGKGKERKGKEGKERKRNKERKN